MNPIKLWPGQPELTASITPFLLDGDTPRAAILVIPGGGYGCVCETTEGSPIARRFNELGYHAFVLDYRVAPHRFPAPIQDAMRAVRTIRAHADEWHVIPDRIASCGFSAGGHLACALGVLQSHVNADAGDAIDRQDARVNAMVLCYAVLSLEPWSNVGTAVNLTGDDPDILRLCSLEKQDLSDAPPALVWATAADQLVDCRNSIVFAQAMFAAKRPCELHLFPFGSHGMLLGLDTRDVGAWTQTTRNFLETQWEMRDLDGAPMERYTNAYQAQREQTPTTNPTF